MMVVMKMIVTAAQQVDFADRVRSGLVAATTALLRTSRHLKHGRLGSEEGLPRQTETHQPSSDEARALELSQGWAFDWTAAAA